MEYVRIAESRIGALIGKEGEAKSSIEKALKVKIEVNSTDCTVNIKNGGDDPLAEWKARDIVRAISYGVGLDDALRLKKDEYTLIIIDIQDIVGRSKKAVARQKARIIGREGKTKEHISALTETVISVKGRRVVIVGGAEEASIARDAIEALAGGLPHGVVYKVLEKRCAAMKKVRKVDLWSHR